MFLMRIALLIALSTAISASAAEPVLGRSELWQLLIQKKFSELDAQLSARQQAYERDFRTKEFVERDLSRTVRVFYVKDESIGPAIDEWVTKMPQSYVASLVRGQFLATIARQRRTGKLAHQVSAAQWAAAKAMARRAGIELERSTTLTERPILSYEWLINISDLYSGSKNINQLLAEANRLDSKNYYANRAYLEMLRPQWGGSMSEMGAFVASYRAQNPPKWKGDCLEALILDQEDWSPNWDPHKPASGPDVAQMNRAIELCPRWDRYSTRGALYWTRSEFALAEKDFREALRLDPGQSYVRAQLGAVLQSRGAFDEAAQVCLQAANAGQPGGMRCLGWAYLNGKGLPKNDTEAFRWVQKCAELDAQTCKADLAEYYWYGTAVEQDKVRAKTLFKEAGADGDANAARRLRALELKAK